MITTKRVLVGGFKIPQAKKWIILGLLLVSAVLAKDETAFAQDAGGDWTTPEDVAAPASEGLDLYGVLVCDSNQNLHALWGKGHQSGSEIYYRTDAEGTFSAPNAVLALPDRVALTLSAAVSDLGPTLHLVWQNDYTKGDVFYSSAPLAEAGDARSWDKPRLMVPDADLATIRADSSGSLHLIYGASDADGYTNSVFHMRSDDDGLDWSKPELVWEVRSEAPSYLMLWTAIDARDRIHVGITIRTQTYGLYSELGYVRSLDGGRTWQPYQAIARQSKATPNVSVIAPFAFGEDEIHLTWHDPRRMHMWSTDGGDTWSTPIQIIELGAGFGGPNYLAKDSAGVLRAVTGVYLGVYVSTFAGGQWQAHQRIEDRDMDPHAQTLVVCQGNQLHVMYDDRVVEDTTVWYAHKAVDAPHINQSPIPTQHPREVAPTLEIHRSSPTPQPQSIADEQAKPFLPTPTSSAASASALPPLLVSTSSVIVLLAAALIWHKRRGR